jgi:tol-pal system protein YbgF
MATVKPICAMSAVAASLLLGACATTPEVDPVAVKLNDVDQRVGRVEAVVNNQSLLELSRRIDALEAQLRSLRGSVEEGQNGSAALGKQQRDLYADLNKRLAALEAAAQAGPDAPALVPLASAPAAKPAMSPAPTKPATVPPPASAATQASSSSVAAPGSGADQAAYDRALAALRAGKYADTIAALRNFSSDHPGTALADNAQYWLGEAYYVTGDFDKAQATFKSVGERWPKSRKAPDALLKLGYTQQMQQDPKAARATLQQVIIRFPDSDAAKLARERLLQLTTENR